MGLKLCAYLAVIFESLFYSLSSGSYVTLRTVAFQIRAVRSTVAVPAMIAGIAPKESTVEAKSNFLRSFFEGNTRNIIKQLGMANNGLEHKKDNCATKGKW